MALPYLLKYVYTHGSDEVIRRGKKIHAVGYVELVENDPLFGSAVFRVKDDNYSTFYKVNVSNYKDPRSLSLRCACPYNLGDICRHEAAVLIRLQEMIDKGMLESDNVMYDQRHTVAKMKTIDLKTVQLLSSPEILSEAEEYLKNNKPVIDSAKEETVKATVNLDGQDFSVIIRKNEERNFDTSSDYQDTEHLLGLPKVIVFLHLLYTKGQQYFETIRNWDKEKNKLLEAYGYTLKDDLKGKFEFNYKDGKPYLRVLDPSIKRIAAPLPTSRPQFETITAVIEKEPEVREQVITKRLGVVFNFNKNSYPFFTTDLVEGEMDEENNFTGNVQKLELGKYVNIDAYNDEDKGLLLLVRKLQDQEINKYVNRNSPFSGIWENIIHHEDDELPGETRGLIAEYLLPRLKKVVSENGNVPAYVLAKGKTFKTANLERVELSSRHILPQFNVTTNGKNFEIECYVKPDAVPFGLQDNEVQSALLFMYNHLLYIWDNAEAVETAEKFLPNGVMKIKAEEWPSTLSKLVMSLTKEYKVDFEKSLVSEIKDGEPEVKLFLHEKGEYLVFQPIFSYKGFDTKAKDKYEMIIPYQDKVIVVYRNREAELRFLEKLQTLHSNFISYDDGAALALKGSDVLKNNWFFLFVDAMNEAKTPVYGFESLKNFRFNTAKPQTHIYISSHTDWFDAKVDIIFGDQKVSVAEVKKALANKQQFVQLNDGTLGILPEEWLKKYSLLFRVGEGRADKLKLSRYHLSVIDELYENRNEEELTIELEEKYSRIREFDKIKEIEAPQNLQPILRPYQVAGYQWLNYLNEVSWGGILADDMGLGKTVQALSFLQHYYEEHDGDLRALVVCPTTLIYNWENEIKKFTPSLEYYIHHGSIRNRNIEELKKHHVIITTYGTLRSDIKIFTQIPLDYVILDESQAIKNPASKVTKAASLLHAKNRLCMSGTPLQNNTFDIYAQMNFLNPGMLGSMEFFRQEFAIPIDKFGETEQKEHLKKILYPFILRRTKEQVAKDLPDKTETVLFCEMEHEQRKIYDAYRNEFRARIMGTIEEQGIQRSQLTILQGLMKLRQICDSPAILNEQEKFENHSIKLDELAREITENIGNHKALIFSQFLGMLALIRQKLEQQGVKYEYFDGSTSAPDREKAIQAFQNDEETRVFLISLKAGGVGLNLTAADYVYIVDPWWNPAVEQQAIDRTHRIGQTKNIFAYRMICKDTIEDKIMQLQEKKRLLAKELISDDATFVKALSREDVEYLFS
ncbi:DEAD/DEAH box helicase [Flavisolibacter ginsengisoli]|uniref:Non-specific serine/threonine protein kinase n=1 Tax=Flavisolibacter ginsengisoli DSM 18119 TaxID=1121884 RepID=A0A1M5CDJ1_9BACT|nr:DEAD/DEAH box helicase [Flavisolibacter ginsengisoli]SHF52502.1 non-specific serine/threonine protein kinase [Flavisolibacter ginsengisoli DSM 18119]